MAQKKSFIPCLLVLTERGRCLICAGEESESQMLLIRSETQRKREKLLRSKWPHINEEIALRKTLTGTQANELRNLGALAYDVTCKWEDRVKKVVLRLGGGEELSRT
jgi:hypothetical protein